MYWPRLPAAVSGTHEHCTPHAALPCIDVMIALAAHANLHNMHTEAAVDVCYSKTCLLTVTNAVFQTNVSHVSSAFEVLPVGSYLKSMNGSYALMISEVSMDAPVASLFITMLWMCPCLVCNRTQCVTSDITPKVQVTPSTPEIKQTLWLADATGRFSRVSWRCAIGLERCYCMQGAAQHMMGLRLPLYCQIRELGQAPAAPSCAGGRRLLL